MKALVIEDDRYISRLLAEALKKERIDTDVATDGGVGLRMAVANHYELVILDLMLPGKNGDEICRQLRNANFNSSIIALTALGDLNSKIKMFNLGVDDYMTKPFEFAELMARIKSALRKQQIELDDIISYQDITVDMKRREVHRRGNKIEMRDKEIKLLEYLIRHAEQVLTREMIMNYVWGPTIERHTNVVDVHIHTLRDKVDRPYGTKMIKTVNNIGYKLSK